MIIKALISVLVIFIIPELIGLLVLRFWKEQKNNVILAFVLGYIIEFAVGQIISVPLILKDETLTKLVSIYSLIIGILSVISLILNVKRTKEILKEFVSEFKKMPKLLTVLLIILIGLQLLVYVKYGHINDDDAFYVATATTSVQTDTLFKYSATIGSQKPGDQVLVRYRLGPFPIYYAIMSKILDIHPAIVAHFILPIIFIPIVYMVYWLFANALFKEDKKSSVMFMIFIVFLHIFSYYSGRNNFIVAMLRIWQGKCVLASIILPFLLILFIYLENSSSKLFAYISIILTVFAGTFTTTMAIAMVPVTLMLLTVIYEFAKLVTKQIKFSKSIKSFIISLTCCIPCFIYGLMYLQDYLK